MNMDIGADCAACCARGPAGQAAKAHLQQELCPGEVIWHWDSHLPAAVAIQAWNGSPSPGLNNHSSPMPSSPARLGIFDRHKHEPGRVLHLEHSLVGGSSLQVGSHQYESAPCPAV